MWSLARCAARLDAKTVSDATLEVRFVRPLLLPAEVCLQEARDAEITRFRLVSPDACTVYLAGSLAGGRD